MNTPSQRGFTMWEMLITLVVVGIVLGMGLPSLMAFQRNNAMSAAANELVTGILLSRAEAVKRQVPITLCASPNPMAAAPTCSSSGAGTNGGFIVWVDENGNVDGNGAPILTDGTDGNAVVDANEVILMQSPEPGGAVNVWGDSGYVSFGPDGFRRQATGVPFTPATQVLYCDDRGNAESSAGSSARVVRVEATGRGQVLRTRNDVTVAAAIIAASGRAASCP